MSDIDSTDQQGAVPPRSRANRPAPTIYDIAELAGVNPSTVSRALNKPGRISAKTEKLIQDAARTLNYRANPMARALPTGRTHTLGLIVADITNPMFFEVVRGAERAAAVGGYTLILAESQESDESRGRDGRPRGALRRRVDPRDHPAHRRADPRRIHAEAARRHQPRDRGCGLHRPRARAGHRAGARPPRRARPHLRGVPVGARRTRG